MRIIPYSDNYWEQVWSVCQPVFEAGETYPYAPDISKEEAHYKWVELPVATYIVVDDDDQLLGSYHIKTNQDPLGAHVCNCGYITAENARGQGVASAMCEHSQVKAKALGYLYMQYNLVIATNEGAVRLWKKHGFTVIGTLPNAFNHKRLGLVNAHIMYKEL